MSTKKNVSASELAAAAVEGKENPAYDTKSNPIIVRIGHAPTITDFAKGFGLGSDTGNVHFHFPFVSYPDSVTDQLHALSISDMIKQGQGSVAEQNPDAYELKPGERFSNDMEVHGLSELEWADPAERFETEQRMNEQFQKTMVVINKSAAEKPAVDLPSPESPKLGKDSESVTE